MKTFAWAVVCGLLFFGATAFAQTGSAGANNENDPTITTWTEQKIDQPPERKIEFKLSDKPLEISRRLGGPGFKIQEFLVSVKLRVPHRREEESSRILFSDEVSPLMNFGRRPFLFPESNRSFPEDEDVSIAHAFTLILKAIPENQRPDPEKTPGLAFFVSNEVNQLLHTEGIGIALRNRTLIGRAEASIREIRFFAKSAEEAEGRAKALLTLLDLGFSRPLQRDIWKNRELNLKGLERSTQGLAKATADIREVEEELKTLTGYTPEMLPQLQLQKLQFDSDRAGLNARVAACQKLKEDKSLSPERRLHIENVQTTAEIDLATLAAREEKHTASITKVNQKISALDRQVKAVAAQKSWQQSISSTRYLLFQYKKGLDIYAPLSVVDDTVTIYPITLVG